MSTATIRIDDDLKARVATAAERAGTTPHAFIIDAIAQTVEQAELEEEFHRIGDQRWTKLLQSGKTVPWDEAKSYLEAKSKGEQAGKPTARRLKPA